MEINMIEKNTFASAKKNKRLAVTVAICLAGALLICILLTVLMQSLTFGGEEYETRPPVNPSKLHETYAEDFNIMEYEEYLGLDRNIYHDDKQSGVLQSVPYDKASTFGEPFVLMYDVILAIIGGDNVQYNSYMGAERLKTGEFTQQQLYNIKISPYSSSESNGCEEYVFKVTYCIHENNGTYRNTIESDVSRPQYFYIDNSTGSFKVMNITE